MDFIQGEDRFQAIMFPELIDDYISAENPVRALDFLVSKLDMKEQGFVKWEPKNTGRPDYNPKDMLKLLIYGFYNRIRSSRRLETETKRNLEVIWLLKKLTPDHVTIARFRKANPEALKKVFKTFVKMCLKWNLFAKELAAIDGSKYKAVNHNDRCFTQKTLEEKLERLDECIQDYLKQLAETDKSEGDLEESEPPKSAEKIRKILNEREDRKETYEGYQKRLEETGETQIALTDPDSRIMVTARGGVDVCYNVQTAVDSKHHLIAAYDVTNQANDKNQLASMSEQVKENLEVEEIAAAADTGYDSVQDIVTCMNNGVTPHVAQTDYDIALPTEEEAPLPITIHKNGRCVYIEERNIVICPMGQSLLPKCFNKSHGTAIFENRKVCRNCTHKCTEAKVGYKRHEVRMPEENFRKTYNTENLRVKQHRVFPDKEKIKQRKCLVEHPFGTMKLWMDGGQFLMTGIENVSGEIALACLTYNLKRVVNILGVKELIERLQRLETPLYFFRICKNALAIFRIVKNNYNSGFARSPF